MRKTVNRVTISGRVYDKSGLEIKTVKNQSSENFGKTFIGGKLDIATDEEGINVVTVYYTYVTPTTKNGSANKTFSILEKIINEGKTWLANGKDEAIKVKLTPSIAPNDFINRDGEMVEASRFEGGFAEFIDTLPENENERGVFTVDMVINNVSFNEGNAERQIPEYTSIKGCVFTFRNEMVPVEFRPRNREAMNYFESLDASSRNPVFTQVRGIVNNIKTKIEVQEESAFGDTYVSYRERNIKENIITWAKPEPYEFDGEDLTAEEFRTIIQNREVHLADVKKRDEEYKASIAAAPSTSSSVAQPSTDVKTGGFKF